MKRWLYLTGGLLVVSVLSFGLTGLSEAAYTSPNYQVNEVFFGNGGNLSQSSTNYQAQTAVGETGVGNSKSTNYQSQSGFNTTTTPLLEVNVSGGILNLGVLSPTSTASTSATFSVRNYLSKGYIVELVGSAPNNGPNGHTMSSPSTPTASITGTEQFALNLAANTTPSVGANPQQIPNNTFGFGFAAANYATANRFMFINGDTIAQSNSSSGQTNYTMSFIENIATSTPGGVYGGSLYVVCIPTF